MLTVIFSIPLDKDVLRLFLIFRLFFRLSRHRTTIFRLVFVYVDTSQLRELHTTTMTFETPGTGFKFVLT